MRSKGRLWIYKGDRIEHVKWAKEQCQWTLRILAQETKCYKDIKVGSKLKHGQSKDMNSAVDSVWSARADLSQKWTCNCVIRREMIFEGEDHICRRKDGIWVQVNAAAIGNQCIILLFACRVWNRWGAGHRSWTEMETLPWLLVKLIGEHRSISEAKRMLVEFHPKVSQPAVPIPRFPRICGFNQPWFENSIFALSTMDFKLRITNWIENGFQFVVCWIPIFKRQAQLTLEQQWVRSTEPIAVENPCITFDAAVSPSQLQTEPTKNSIFYGDEGRELGAQGWESAVRNEKYCFWFVVSWISRWETDVKSDCIENICS